jgi:hypothetical protein
MDECLIIVCRIDYIDFMGIIIGGISALITDEELAESCAFQTGE